MRVTQIVVVRQGYRGQGNLLAFRIEAARSDVNAREKIWVAPEQIVGRAVFLKNDNHILDEIAISRNLCERSRCTQRDY